jgi:beta-glucosidase
MARMTVDEKIGQLNLPHLEISPQEHVVQVAKNMKKAKLALFNIKSVERLKKYKGSLLKKPIKIHCFFGMDVIHGYETTFPFP